MTIEERPQSGYEQVVYCQDESVGLKGFIAVHNTTLGPSLGGTRMYPYKREEDALTDVLRLSRGMTYKSAAAGLSLGGGKSVIIGDPARDKTEALLRAFGRCVQQLNGRYIAAEDVGTSVSDMDIINQETSFVAGTSANSGDPSSATAFGVLQGMRAAVHEVYGHENFKGLTVAIQGLGHVGINLCQLLSREGARLVVTDVNQDRVREITGEFGATAVDPGEIYQVECDIFSPCALGAVVNDQTVNLLRTKIVAGSANNILAEDKHADMLEKKGILYAPDFIINAGGIINVADGLNGGYNKDRAWKKVAAIYDTILKVFQLARQNNISTGQAALLLSEEILRNASSGQQ